MFASRLRRLVLATLALAAPAAARAQAPEPEPPMYEMAAPRLSFGGEVTTTAGPADADAFFNYTDYSTDALRTLRLRLFAEVHVAGRTSAVVELRSQNMGIPIAEALYVRWRPFANHDLSIQGGRIPPVIGAFGRRAYGRDNAVIGQPLAYQYLTSLRPDAVPTSVDDLLRMRGRGWAPSFPIGANTDAPGVPLIASSNWDTGVEAVWQQAAFNVAASLTRGAPAVPIVRETNGGLMWAGRGAVHLRGLTAGLSVARGEWLTDGVLALTPLGRTAPAAQTLIGADAEVGLGQWLVRAEWMTSTFDLPIVDADPPTLRLGAHSGFLEGRYRLRPRWELGLRLDMLTFSAVTSPSLAPDARGARSAPWDAPVQRAEAALGFRVTRHMEVRGGWQQNWRQGGRVRVRGVPALSATYWF
ncbi:MAG: hypothetical protein ABI652_01855 [Acidobacteriota bacterium]